VKTSIRACVALLATAILIPTACGDGEDSSAPTRSDRVTLHPLGSVDGAPAGYAAYLPPGYGDGTPRPLLLFLHGAGENGSGSRSDLALVSVSSIPVLVRRDLWPESRPFVVLMPQHRGGQGGLCPNAAEIDAFLSFATRHYDIDRRRIYLTGVSCGAIGAWEYLGVHTNEVVAAAVLIAGDGNRAVAQADCALGRVPIWAIHGARDDVVSPYGSIRPITLLKRCTHPAPVDLRLTVYPGVGHDAWAQTYDLSAGYDIYAWLLRHRRAALSGG
jgi:predicted peptidase